MLTRLKIRGFKNMTDVDVRFGPFTCIAGANGVGKSNLFDAISFLAALAEKPLIDAALSVRDEGGRTGDIRTLFHRIGEHYDPEMSFEAEMLVPKSGFDDLGQSARAATTFLRYSLTLRYRDDKLSPSAGGLEIVKEELSHIKIRDAKKHLSFTTSQQWLHSVLSGKRTTPFISTDGEHGSTKIMIHQDGTQGRTRQFSAENLPRTILSTTNAAEMPTTTLARREMQSWQLLQLEPTAMRSPDSFTAAAHLSSDGRHLPATLYRMARVATESNNPEPSSHTNPIYAQVANRLSELIDDVGELHISRDEKRELLTLFVSGKDGTAHPARALSDGTLRFLALAVLNIDQDSQGLLCLEEPENGIHPLRIPAILNLLEGIAVDTEDSVSPENPLRQVIINTHSPSVVAQVNEDSLLLAESMTLKSDLGISYRALSFSCLQKTWRAELTGARIIARGKVMEYLNPVSPSDMHSYDDTPLTKPPCRKRVMDRDDLQMTLAYDE
jgi:predicted ATPase